MREIKFRAWNLRDKKMTYDGFGPYETELFLYLNGERGFTYGGRTETYEALPEEESPFILMQYTGLKDKSGKEIYEGDIVTEGAGPLVVEWCEQEIGWRLYCGVLYQAHEDIPQVAEWMNLKVIGNIHENSDLVKP
jgi:hypothetical protein